jgi:hypothetical protein
MKIKLTEDAWRTIAEYLVEEEVDGFCPYECTVLIQAIEDKLGESFREDPDEEETTQEVNRIYIVKTPDGDEFRETLDEPKIEEGEEFVEWVANY